MYFTFYFMLFISAVLSKSDTPCKKLEAQYGQVCVCDSSYCDTINPPKQLHKGQFHFYYSSKQNPGFNHEVGHFKDQSDSSHGIKFVVNATKKYQTIRGFGGAFTDAFGYVVNSLSHKAQEKLMKSYFSEEGIEYSVGRVVLGSSDFSLRNYSYLPEYDPTLKSFNLTNDDYIYKISKMKWALKTTKRHMHFLGSTWSSPPWMKIRNTTTSGFLKPEFRQLWADYYVKALDSFKKEGIDFWGLTTGNEPVTLYLVKYVPNLAILPEEQRDWVVENFGPALRKANYNLTIVFLDDMRLFVTWWMKEINRDPRIKDYSTGVGLHWYTDVMSDPKVLNELHDEHPEQEIIYTESSINIVVNDMVNNQEEQSCSSCPKFVAGKSGKPQLGSWRRAGMFATNIIENLNHWVTTYIDWNLALNLTGGPNLYHTPCDASIIVDEHKDRFYKQPLYYVLGHFSKFMAPKSIVIDVHEINGTKPDSQSYLRTEDLSNSEGKKWKPYINNNVQCTGVLNPDGSHAITFYNPKSIGVKIIVRNPTRGHAVLMLKENSISTLIYW